MPLVNAKCTNCGANLEVDSAAKTAFCSFCGSSFIVEQAIHNYKITNVINAKEVFVQGEDKKERLFKNAKTYEKFKDYSKASQIYTEITEEYPNDYRGWLGLATIMTDSFNNVDSNHNDYEIVSSHMKKVLMCAPADQKAGISSQWEDYKKGRSSFISHQEAKLQNLESEKADLEKSIEESEDKHKNYSKVSNKAYDKSKLDEVGFVIELLVWGIIITVAGVLVNIFFRFPVVLIIGIIITIIPIIVFIRQIVNKSKYRTYNKMEKTEKDELDELKKKRYELQEEINTIKDEYGL